MHSRWVAAQGTRPSARLGHAAVLHTANGDGAAEKLLVFGGWSGRKYADNELRELHVSADWTWRRVLSGGQPPLARAYHTATRLAGQRMLIFGGHDAELRTFKRPSVLDLGAMAWHHPEAKGTPPAPRTGHAAVCLDGHRVLIHGGWEVQRARDRAVGPTARPTARPPVRAPSRPSAHPSRCPPRARRSRPSRTAKSATTCTRTSRCCARRRGSGPRPS